MTGEINLPPLPAPATALPRPLAGGEVLKLQTPIADLIAPGQSAKAEVLSLRQEQQVFQLLLKLTLAGGRQTTVSATSNLPLALGTSLAITQPSAGNLAITLQQALASNTAALTRLDTAQLPVGTLLQGKVLTNQALSQAPGQPPVYRSMVSLLNTALSGSTLTLDSTQPLRIGTLLSALVQDADTLNFVPMSSRSEQLAIAQQLQTQQSRQGSLEGLLKTLQNLPADSQTASVRAAVETLLAGLPGARHLSNPKVLAQALANSGVFLESKLLAGPAEAPANDTKGNLLRLIAQLAPGLPANTSFNAAIAANTMAQALPSFVRNALGMLGQVSAKPTPGGFPLPSRLLQSLDQEGDLEHLLRLAAAAVSRLQSHQLASLEQSGMTEDGRLQTTWQLEIPMRHAHDIVPLQVKLQREDPPPREQQEKPAEQSVKQPLWRLDLAFDLEPLGPLQVQAQLLHGSLSGQLWAERPYTASLIENNLDSLRAQLHDCGLNVSGLDCHLGKPPQGPQTRLEQRWVDDTA